MEGFLQPSSNDARRLSSALLRWFEAAQRTLPWRSEPTPYRVWVSEIMLQQTRVEAVKPYFARFMKRLPNIEALANVSEEELLSLWEGLGYYNRARNLQKAAKTVMREYGGELPNTREELLKLSGIGEYTAAAIASISFGEAVPAVDGNVLRVLSRLFGIDADIRAEKNKKVFTELDAALLPKHRAGDFNQAMMELGATVCLPNGEPHCNYCPFAGDCVAYKEGKIHLLPYKSPKKPRRLEERTVLLITTPEHRFLLHRRPNSGLLAGMWEFVQLSGALSADEAAAFAESLGLQVSKVTPLPAAVHLFTHIEWQLSGYLLVCSKEVSVPRCEFVDMANRQSHAVPSAFRVYTDIAERISSGFSTNILDNSDETEEENG